MAALPEDLGQHLLRDADAIARIVGAAALRPGERVLDAGAGAGALTLPLAEAVGPTGRVLAVELDPRMIAELEAHRLANVDIVRADLLEMGFPLDLDAIVANPPFRILAPLIERIVAARIPRAVLVVPGELAERLTAAPGSARYGPLTIRVRAFADVSVVAGLSRRAFRPAPTVPCAVLSLRAKVAAPRVAMADLALVIEAAMAQDTRKAKYAWAKLPDAFRVDSLAFQERLRAAGWADEVVGRLPPGVYAEVAAQLALARDAR